MTYSKNYNSTVVSVTTSATAVLPRDNSRKALIMFNQGATDIRWYFETNSTMYFTLKAGEGIHFSEPPQNAINAVTVSGTSALTVMEA